MLWFLTLRTTWNLRLPDARSGCCGKGGVFAWCTASPLRSDPEHLLLWHLLCSCTMCRIAKPSMDFQGWYIKCLEPWHQLVVDLCDVFATDIASCMKENCSSSLDWEHHEHKKFSDRGRLQWHFRSCILSEKKAAVCMLLLPVQGILHSDMPFPSASPKQTASKLFGSLGTGAKPQKALSSVWILDCRVLLCGAALSSCSPMATGDDTVCIILGTDKFYKKREKKKESLTFWVNSPVPVFWGHSGEHRDVGPSVTLLRGQ